MSTPVERERDGGPRQARADAFELWVESGSERRRFSASAFPLGLGGAEEPIRLDVPVQCGRIAQLVREGEELALEPFGADEPLLLNDRLLEAHTLLHLGDRIRAGRSELRLGRGAHGALELCALSADAVTLPPLHATPPPAEDTIEVVPVALAPLRAPRAQRGPRRRWSARRWSAAAAAALLLLGGSTLALLSVSVQVRSEPPGARLRWPDSGWSIGTGEQRWLLPGRHRVELELEGYEPAARELEVPAGGIEPLVVALAPLPGLLSVRSEPAGAQLEVDGAPRGATPLEKLELPAGKHRLRASAPRHLPTELEVEIEGRGAQQQAELRLQPNFAPVAVRSEPAGASVLVDGEPRGRTPLSLELEAGPRSLELALDGYETHRQSVEVQANQPLELGPIALASARARVALSSDPPGAQVTVGGQYRGSTPLTLALEPGAEHEFGVSKPGYRAESRMLRVASGETRELRVALEPRLGAVRVRARPPDSELFIDGKSMGPANQRLELVAIAHELEVRREGYQPYRTALIPRPGFEKRLDVTLERRGAPRPAAIAARASAPPLRLASPVGPSLVRVEPGGLAMGSPTSDPERRANETPRRVVLTRAYYIGAREISNREFRAFRPEHRSGASSGNSLDADEQPAVQLSWDDAARFCNWLSAQESLPPAYEERDGQMVPIAPVPRGYRLPSEAEWAFAARAGGAAERAFPWGERLPPPERSGNFADRSAAELLEVALSSYSDGFAASSPTGSFAPSSLGLYDIGGNAAEWIHDYYSIPAPEQGLEQDPLGPPRGVYHVIRGSSWKHATRTELRLEYRDYGDGPREDLGFRIARYAD